MFWPDPRFGERQRACGAESCQRRRRAKTQAAWRSRNPSYQTAYRLEKRAAVAAEAAKAAKAATATASERDGWRPGQGPVGLPPPPRVPAALSTFPWDLVKARLGFAVADLLVVLAVRLASMAPEPRARSSGRVVNVAKDP